MESRRPGCVSSAVSCHVKQGFTYVKADYCIVIRIIPTGFFPLRYLSFSSAIGIISTWALVAILIFSGITT